MTANAQAEAKRQRKSDIWAALTMGGPGFLLLLTFLIGPFLMGIWFSFTNQRLISPNPTESVGMRNFQRLLKFSVLTLEPQVDEATGELLRDEEGALQYPRSRQFTRDEENYPQYTGLREWFNIDTKNKRYVILAGDPTFMRALRNNIFFSVVIIPTQSIAGLILALLVNSQIPGKNFFRTIYFAPVVTSMVVLSILWRYFYDLNSGLFNQLLSNFNVGPINWLGDPDMAMWSIIIMSVWQGCGFQMMLFLAGLQGIPGVLYEAADIDGASAWQKLWNVTLPGLRNTTIFIIITITIAAFQLFTQPWVMTNGGPNEATVTTAFHMVMKGFREQNIAYASAISVVFFLIILGINLVQRFLLREEEL